MKKLALCFLTISLSIHCRSQEIPAEKIEEWLSLYNVPGAAMAIIEDGQVRSIKGYGLSNLEKKSAVTEQTGFNIGSISKMVTAWGVMKLVEAGKLSLDVPVSQYVKRWKFPASEYDPEKVTVRGLLGHTAGVSLHGFRGFSLGDNIPTLTAYLNRKDQNGQPVIRLVSNPGTEWRYSGGGYLILQLIVEKVTGQDFGQYMREEILKPLGMYNSSFTINEAVVNASSKEYSTTGELLPFQIFTAKGAAGLQTTVEDLAKFALANLEMDSGVLKESTLKEMMAPTRVSNGTFGLGYQVQALSDEGPILVGHAGSNLGWHAFYRIDPLKKRGFIMLTNSGYGWNVYRRAYCYWLKHTIGSHPEQGCQTSILATMIGPLQKSGVDAALAIYTRLKTESPELFDINPNQLVSLGRLLLRQNKFKDAIKILEFNAQQFPNSTPTFSTLGNVYEANGQIDLAKSLYRKSLEMDSTLHAIRQRLERLEKN